MIWQEKQDRTEVVIIQEQEEEQEDMIIPLNGGILTWHPEIGDKADLTDNHRPTLLHLIMVVVVLVVRVDLMDLVKQVLAVLDLQQEVW